MKLFKYALLALGALVVVAFAFAAYLIATFDARDHAPRIVALVKEKTGRTLRIAGDFKLGFWPDVSVKLGSVTLSERDSEEAFAAAESVRVTVKLVPLFSRRLVAETLFVEGARVQITRYADGRLNIADLIGSDGPPPEFDIGGLRVQRSALAYHDVATDRRYELTAIDVETGRLTSPTVTPLKLSFSAHDFAKSFEIGGKLDARLALDLAQGRYALEQAALGLSGRFGEVSGLSAQVKGSFSAQPKAGALEAVEVAAEASGERGGQKLHASLQALKLTVHGSALTAQSASVSVTAADGARNTRLTLAAPAVTRNGDAMKLEPATIELDATQGEYELHASLASPVEVQLGSGAVALPKLEAAVRLRGARLPARGLSGTLAGHVRLERESETATSSLAGTFAGSRIKADLAATGFATPVYRFAIDVDQFDLDRYSAGSAPRTGSTGEFDLSAVASLPATGTLHIGTLTTGGLKARNVRLAVKP